MMYKRCNVYDVKIYYTELFPYPGMFLYLSLFPYPVLYPFLFYAL